MSSVSTATNSSVKFRGSRIPTLKGNVQGARENVSSQATETPVDKGKSAGELKQRLASAVSAKIAAANRDGRTTPTNNRGIGYLLQRKQQADSRLNTKDISFQKPLLNNNGGSTKDAQAEAAKNGGNFKNNDLGRPASQKSLLSVLMSSRVPSGTAQGKQTASRSRLDDAAIRKPTDNSSGQTMSGANKRTSLGKTFPPAVAPKVGQSNSRDFSRLLQEKKLRKPLANDAVTSSNRPGIDRPANSILLVNNVRNSKPSDKINDVKKPNVNEPKQLANNKPVLDNEIRRNKQLLSEIESHGNSRTASRPAVKTKTPPAVLPKPNSSLRNVAARKNSSFPRKHDKYNEDLLEKLEADVGSCKIAAFQTMEDFSVLRMRVYRIRGELELLKKERETQTPV